MPAARNSLRAMSDVLTSPLCGWPGQRVAVFEDNSTRDGLDQEIARLIHDTADVLLFYYVGHGQLLDGEHLGLALADTRADPNMRHATSLRLSELRTELKYRCKARVRIVILDCCFSGLATRNTQGGVGVLADQVQLATKVEGAYTLAAARHWQKARHEDGADGLTYFTRFFTEIVRDGIPGKGVTLTLREIHDEVADRCLNLELPDGETRPEPSTLVVDTAEQFPFAANAAHPEVADALPRPDADTVGTLQEGTAPRRLLAALARRVPTPVRRVGVAMVAVFLVMVVTLWMPLRPQDGATPPGASPVSAAPTARQVAVLTGHANAVTHVLFSRDGHTLATAGADQTVRLWDVAGRRQLGEPFTGYIASMALSPDSRALAITGIISTATLWDVDSHRQLGEPFGKPPQYASCAVFSPDGASLATGSALGTVLLWDVASRRQLGEPLAGHDKGVTAMAFSPDGRMLATTGPDLTVRLWDVSSHQQLGDPLTGHANLADNLMFSPDGSTLYTSSKDGTLRLWDVSSHRQLDSPLTGYTGTARLVALSPNGRALAIVGTDAVVRLWDVSSHRQLGQPFGQASIVGGMAFSPDGRTLAAAGLDNTVRMWDVSGLY
jgi:WD40 repeat protein